MLMSRWLDDETIAAASAPADGKAADGQSPGSKPADSKAADSEPAGSKPPGTAQSAIVQPERFKVCFRGQMIMLFGETTPTSGKYRVLVDGRRIEYREAKDKPPADEFDAGRFGRAVHGNAHLVQVIAEGLDPAIEHTLEIEPAFDLPNQELRLESICVAGGAAARREGRLSPPPNPANQILGALVRNPTLALFFPEAITKTPLTSERMTTL